MCHLLIEYESALPHTRYHYHLGWQQPVDYVLFMDEVVNSQESWIFVFLFLPHLPASRLLNGFANSQAPDFFLCLIHPQKCAWVALFWEKCAIALFCQKSAIHSSCTFFLTAVALFLRWFRLKKFSGAWFFFLMSQSPTKMCMSCTFLGEMCNCTYLSEKCNSFELHCFLKLQLHFFRWLRLNKFSVNWDIDKPKFYIWA